VLKSPETAERLVPQGVDIYASTPEYFAEALRNTLVKSAKLVKDAGIKIDQ
jgi:hypothetical protein